MSSKKRKQKRNVHAASTPPEATTEATAPATVVDDRSPWTTYQRAIASVFILAYLLVLIIGPLSNPISSKHLTAPLAVTLSPLHRGLFMGHGYRFFAPNPSDSHLVQYKITKEDGTQIEGVFPDRENVWPRLLYHRWFMLSETIFAEHAQTPSPNEFEKLDREKSERVKLLLKSGRLKLGNELEKQRTEEEAKYKKTLLRIRSLVRATGKFLLERYDGDEIEISVVTRTIPFPVEVSQGADLDDDVFLRYPANRVIGRFRKSDFAKSPGFSTKSQNQSRRLGDRPGFSQAPTVAIAKRAGLGTKPSITEAAR